jgi:CRISPR-associated exonuclease Cas4
VFSQDDLIPLSALQHTLFCERQCALIHVEQVWEENRYTAEGRDLHERVDEEHHERRKLRRVEYGLAVRSLEHGLIGKCDVVEFTLQPQGGYQSVVPVEFKRGKQKESDADRVQLCAQALCLEEMFGLPVPYGEFYYLQEHRRSSIDFDRDLRERTVTVLSRTQEIIIGGQTPPAVYSKETCDRCSLVDLCMPKLSGSDAKSVSRYIQNQIRRSRPEAI